VFTEKDHSKDTQPELKALFGNMQRAWSLEFTPTEKVVTCDKSRTRRLKQKQLVHLPQ